MDKQMDEVAAALAEVERILTRHRRRLQSSPCPPYTGRAS
jgi:hypothetical protein